MVLLVHLLTFSPAHQLPSKFGKDFSKPQFLPPTTALCSTIFKTKFTSNAASFNCSCTKNEITDQSSEFSGLASESPWDSGSVWSNMAFYMFSLHIPLSFGGLSAVAYILHQPVLDPETEALSLLVIQTLELIGALILLRSTAKPHYRLVNFFIPNKLTKKRNWLLSSVVGFVFLLLLVFVSSLLADRLYGPKAVNNPILKEILLSSSISESACVLVYCVVSPLLEEVIYRGFLLASLASTMKWQHAVVISSAIFSAAHFSGEDSLQLFIIGCVLGCSYCWTGNLSSSVLMHSLYNAMTLLVTYLS